MTLDIALQISLVLFMVGNLLDMGLLLKLQEAIAALRDVRFVTLSLLWGFILLPGLAYLLTVVVPLDAPIAIGLVLLAMAPCAPFLPPMADKAGGDRGYTAAFMLLASVATVVYMPLAVPVLVKGFSAGAWTIAKPLLFFLLVPLAIGTAIQLRSASVASKLQPIVKKVTGIDTLLMLVSVRGDLRQGVSRAGRKLCHRGADSIFLSSGRRSVSRSASGCPEVKRSCCRSVCARAMSAPRWRRCLPYPTWISARS